MGFDRPHVTAIVAGLAALALAGSIATAAAASQGEAVAAGREVYLRKCASCHGEAATGYGPESRDLRQRPTDLTVLSDRTRRFDRESVRAGITGRIRLDSPFGTGGMPHWRGSLDAAVPTANGVLTELDALLAFLETIQREPYGPFPGISTEALASAGAPLFASHCAACHGPKGRGLPASAATPGPSPPDLTTIASRNGGTIDIRSLYELIARRAHSGGGAMPAWDQVLRKAGWPAPLVTKNLEAIARYVESIQQR